MAALVVEDLLRQARAGVKLDADSRRRCLTYLMATEPGLTNRELAETFQVSDKTIRDDKQTFRQEVADEIEHDDIRLVIADLKISFTEQRRELEKGKKRCEPGTKLHLEYTRALIDLDIKMTDTYQRIGILPDNAGANIKEEFTYIAVVAKGDKVDVKRLEEFEPTELKRLGIDPKQLREAQTAKVEKVEFIDNDKMDSVSIPKPKQ